MERLTVNDLNKVCYDPWELCGMDSYCTKGCHEEGGCTKGCEILKMYRKLAEYEDLEEQSLLLKLPCKVSDAVYMPYINTILERKIDVINIYRYTMRIHLCNTSLFVEPNDFGKTVFLTKAEAEESLKRMEGENETD